MPVRPGAVLLIAGLLALGCAYTQKTELPRSALEQALATGAIDRALAKLEWPDVAGKSLVVRLGAPEESFDRAYLLRSIEIEVVQRGGIVAAAESEADHALNVLVAAVGVDESGRFFGVPGSSGGLIPVAIPELALYKTQRWDGFAKLSLALLDRRSGGVVHRSGPEPATTYARTRTLIFVFRSRWSDVEHFERQEPSSGDAY